MYTAGYARDYQPAIEHLEKEFARIARTLAPEVVAQLRKNISFAPQFDAKDKPAEAEDAHEGLIAGGNNLQESLQTLPR